MDKLKYIKLENEDGSYSDSIPLAVDSDHVDVNGSTLTNELANKASTEFVNSNINNLNNKISRLASGSPLVANSVTEMIDTSKTYVNTSDGNWYYYNGNLWIVGGIYQSTGIGEKSIYKKMLEQKLQNNFKMEMEEVTGITWNTGGFYNGVGDLLSNASYSYSNAINVNPNEVYMYPNHFNYSVSFWDSSNTFVNYVKGNVDGMKPFIIPDNVTSIKLNKHNSETLYNPGKLYKIKNYYLNGQSKIMYGDMDNAFKNSFLPVYEDITNQFTFIDGFWNRNNKNIITENNNPNTNFHYTQFNVIPGEKYRISGSVIGNVLLYQLIGNDGTNVINYPIDSVSESTDYTVELTIPDNIYLLNISGYKNGIKKDIKIEKVNSYEFIGVINIDTYDIKQLQKFNIEQQLKNDFKWSHNIKKYKYATFTFDDSLADISDIETLFESKNVPCCFATVPSRLNNLTRSGETVKQVLQRAISNGGEVLSHWDSPLTSASTDNDYYDVYVNSKKILENEGFNINGIITAGGTDYQTQNFTKDIEIARNNYFYADLTATNNISIEQYWNRRNFLDNGVTSVKTLIDNYINDTDQQPYSKWLNFASHGTKDTSLEDIGEIIDYCLSNNIQIVTWKYIYDNYKSSKLEERIYELEH